MSVLDILTEEHVLLRRFIGRLQWEEPEGSETCARMRKDLLAFFCSLQRHEDFEGEIFRGLDGAAVDPGGLAEELIAEHRKLLARRVEIFEALKNAREDSSAQLKPHVDALADHLRADFAWEEKHLWPHYRPSLNPGVERSLEREALPRLDRLEADMALCGILLSDSSGRGPDLRPRRPAGL